MVRIFIIHHSEIIRNGIASLLKGNFSNEVIGCSDLKNISLPEKTMDLYIIFVPIQSKDLVKLKKKNHSGSVKIIGIIERSDEQKQSTEVDAVINLSDTSTKINDVVSHLTARYQNKYLEITANPELTSREIDVLKLVALGKINKEIADELFISTHTVISHRKNITEKLGIKSISGLTIYAMLNNLIDPSNLESQILT